MRQTERNSKDCTIIILSYNTQKTTDICLKHAKKAADYAQKVLHNTVEIIVFDNGSQDNSVQMIQKKHPYVKLIRSDRNLGFARGNNEAMRYAKTPYLWILNSDAFLNQETVVNGVKYLHHHDEFDGLVGALRYPDGSFQPSWGHLPTPVKTILWSIGVESMPVLKKYIRPIYALDNTLYKSARPVEWCSSASFLIRKKVYKKTKGYDPNIFLYTEDVEFCKRIKDKGMHIVYTPNIVTVHIGAASSKNSDIKQELQWQLKGMSYFHKKHYPKFAFIVNSFLHAGIVLRSFLLNRTSHIL